MVDVGDLVRGGASSFSDARDVYEFVIVCVALGPGSE
jgi:hypothetical protein